MSTLDQAMNYLADMVEEEVVTFAKLSKNWTFRRIGKVVFLEAPADSKNVVAGMNTIGTLPTSMRPISLLRVGIGNGASTSAFLQIGTDGVVQFYSAQAAASARNCSISTSFVVQ